MIEPEDILRVLDAYAAIVIEQQGGLRSPKLSREVQLAQAIRLLLVSRTQIGECCGCSRGDTELYEELGKLALPPVP